MLREYFFNYVYIVNKGCNTQLSFNFWRGLLYQGETLAILEFVRNLLIFSYRYQQMIWTLQMTVAKLWRYQTLANLTSLYYCTIANTWSNIIDSVLALVNKQKNTGAEAAVLHRYQDGDQGMAIFMHSIAVIS